MATQNINIVIRTAGGTTVVRQLNQIGASASNAASRLATLQRQLHAITALLAVGVIAHWADEWTAAANKIKVFAVTQGEANEVLDRLYDVALKVGQPLNSIVDLYHKLSIQAKALGASTEQNIQITETVNKALTIQGTSANTAKGALLQLSQAFGTGRVKAQEYNSLLTGTPLLLKIIAENVEGAGGSVAKLTAIQRAGKLSSQDLFQGLLKGGAQVNELFGKMNRTFGQAFENLITGLTKFFGELNNSLGLSTKFFNLTLFISANLQSIAKWLVVVGVGVATAFAPTIISAFAAALTIAAAAMARLTILLLSNPFILIATAVAAVVLFGDSWLLGIDNLTTFKDLFDAFVDELVSGFNIAAEVITGWWVSLSSVVADFYGVASNVTEQSVGDWFNSYAAFFSDVEGGFVGILRVIARTMDAIAGLITGTAIAIGRIFAGLPAIIGNIFAQVYNEITGWMSKAINVVIGGINILRKAVGTQLIESVQFEKMQVNTKLFQDYGRDIVASIDDGFAIQGGFMESQLNKVIDKATASAKARLAQTTQKELVDLTIAPDALDPSGVASKDKKGRNHSDFARYNQMTLERMALAKAELASVSGLSKAEQDRIKFLSDIDSAKLTQPERELLKLRYESIYAMEAEVTKREEVREAIENARKEREKAQEALKDYGKSLETTLGDVVFETSLLGMNAEAQKRMTALRYLDIEAQRALLAVQADPGAVQEVMQRNKIAHKQLSDALDQQLAKQKELNASWEYGATIALEAYLKKTQDVAGATESLVTDSFKAMEDDLVRFVTTGKLNFASLFTTLGEGLARLYIQSKVLGPIADVLNGKSGSSSGGGGLLNSLVGGAMSFFGGGSSVSQAPIPWDLGFAEGGNPPTNRPYLVGENGPELRVDRRPSTIIPNSELGGNTNKVFIENTFILQQVPDVRTQDQIAVKIGSQVDRALVRNT